MVIKKVPSTFNDYQLTASWSQLIAIQHALAENHADVIRDEVHKTISYYLDNLCPPGMDEDEYKAAKTAEKDAEKQSAESEERDLTHLGDETEFGKGDDVLQSDSKKGTSKKSDEKSADDYLSAPPSE